MILRCRPRLKITMGSFLLQVKMCVICLSSAHAIWTLSTAPTLRDWYYGYRVIVLLAELQAAWSYCNVGLQILSETIKRLQYAAVSTTGRAEALSLCREHRAWQARLDRRSTHAFHGQRHAPLLHHDEHNRVPAVWPVLSLTLLLYNTVHLAIGAPTDLYALLFGAPAIAAYVTIIRATQVLFQ